MLRELSDDPGRWYVAAPTMAYALSISLTGIFSTSPCETGVPHSAEESEMHSLFANIAGIAFTAATLGLLLTEDDLRMRLVHLAGLSIVTFSSIMSNMQPEYRGIYQRILWAGGLSWLTVSFAL